MFYMKVYAKVHAHLAPHLPIYEFRNAGLAGRSTSG